MYIIVQMMQDKETEGSTSFSEISVYNEAPQTANADEIQPIIDFDSIEDILDFDLHSPTEASNSKSDKERPPRLRKMIAQEPVKLLELKPIIDNFVDDQAQHQILWMMRMMKQKLRAEDFSASFVEVNFYDLLICIVICDFIQEPNLTPVPFAGNDFQGVTVRQLMPFLIA